MKITNKVLKTFRYSLWFGSAFLFVILRCLDPTTEINKKEGEKNKPELSVACSYFHCKMQHIFILELVIEN